MQDKYWKNVINTLWTYFLAGKHKVKEYLSVVAYTLINIYICFFCEVLTPGTVQSKTHKSNSNCWIDFNFVKTPFTFEHYLRHIFLSLNFPLIYIKMQLLQKWPLVNYFLQVMFKGQLEHCEASSLLFVCRSHFKYAWTITPLAKLSNPTVSSIIIKIMRINKIHK